MLRIFVYYERTSGSIFGCIGHSLLNWLYFVEKISQISVFGSCSIRNYGFGICGSTQTITVYSIPKNVLNLTAENKL
jgi:hypothetical protein